MLLKFCPRQQLWMRRGNLSGSLWLWEYGFMDPAQAQLCLNGIIHDDHHQHLHERHTTNDGASTRLSHNWSACTDGHVAGLQPTGSCWGRQGTSASVHAGLSQAMGAWCRKLAPAMTLGPPSTGCCLRRSRGTSSHPIPAGSAPASAGKVCPSCHQS